MGKFIIFLDRLLTLYIYYIIAICILSWVPNINPDFPLFHFLYTAAGFYVIPSFMGVSFSPALIMAVCAFAIMGLRKIYDKFFAKKQPEIIIITKDELIDKLQQENKDKEDKNDSL